MAKRQSLLAANQLTAKKPLHVSTPAKKLMEDIASTSKKQTVLNPPPESPSEDKKMENEEEQTDYSSEEENEEEQSDSSSEEEDEPKSKDSGKNPQSPSASAPIVAATVIQSGSETESGESDTETEPASTKPPPSPPAREASPRTLRKRTIQVTTSSDAKSTTTKRAKTETAKKASFPRVWSEEDEIALLEAMLKFKEETEKNPSEDTSEFHKKVKDSINFKEKSFSQFTSKVFKLKSKYLGKNTSRVSFTKPHCLKCLELCKKIWVMDLVSPSAVVKSEKKIRVDGVKEDSDWFERSYLARAVLDLGLVGDDSLKKKWTLVPVEIKKKLEEKFKLMQADDFKRVMQKTEFLHEVSTAIANA